MIPRDWGFKLGGLLVLHDRWLPLWYDNIKDYKHANAMWSLNGKWKQERPNIQIYTVTHKILTRKMKKVKML